jgi:hypothetical protein
VVIIPVSQIIRIREIKPSPGTETPRYCTNIGPIMESSLRRIKAIRAKVKKTGKMTRRPATN